MKCSIYERRPPTLRVISDTRAAKFIETIEFEDRGNHDANKAEIVRDLLKKGFKLATSPSASPHPEYDYIIYVEPSMEASPRQAFEQQRKPTRRKPVVIAGATGINRKMPLPGSKT